MNCRSTSGRGRSIRHLFTIEDTVGRTVSNRYKPSFLTSSLVSFLIAFAALTTPSLYANHGGTANGVCMVERYNATQPPNFDNLGCSAGDVSLAIYEVVTGPSSCIAGEMIDVSLKGDFTAGSDERWDVGVFISQDGGTPNALGGSCYSDYLHPASLDPDNEDLDLSGGAGPYYNGEPPADLCGDIEQDEPATFITGVFSIPCQDEDGDFRADVRSCTVWANNTSDGTSNKPHCSDESDVTADTSSKCDCSLVNISGIEVRETANIEVIKDLVPNSDLGKFNLRIDDANVVTDVGDGGTTGSVSVSAGTSGTPGGNHTVGETAGTLTSLGSYTTSISCVDRGLETFNGEAPLIQANAGPLNVPVDPNDDIVCTITNTNGCETTTCDDTACGVFACDPAGAVGNCDSVTYKTGEMCRAGSGDSCDPSEYCVAGVDTCPTDSYLGSSTVCRPGSGDACDPDEMCPGVPGQACPNDNVASPGTVCNEGSGDACDPDEVCSGNVEDACPDDSFEPDTTVCNEGSGDLCDPDEFCPGTADAACPDDNVADQGTVCDTGSGDLCDPDEVCSGNPDESCPDDTVTGEGTLCREGSGDACDTDELCTGIAEEACPDDDAPGNEGNLCRDGNGVPGDLCDLDELCTGVPGEDCPNDDTDSNQGKVCRVSGTGFEDCDPAEVCLGESGSVCPDDYIEPEFKPCGDQSTTECSDPDYCDDSGICLYNNKVCGSVTNSSLCQYDMEPTKGTCVGGTSEGGACFIDDPCIQGGGVCDANTCMGGVEDGTFCTVPDTDPCESGGGSCVEGQCDGGAYAGVACCYAGGGICEQSDQFRLLFTPDVQNWVAYKLNASNPGQTFYNLVYNASGAGDSDVSLTVTIPYPYVTVGGSPLHIYDADTVGSNGQGCLAPEGAIRSEPLHITLDDWILGANGIGNYNLVCDQVQDPGGAGFCSFDVLVLNEEIPEGGLLYVNVHLDHGLKGKSVDANPVGPDGAGMMADRYDRDGYISPWGSSDALVNSSSDNGPLALADCQPYWFEHSETEAAATEPLFEDKLENLNMFKGANGLFGRVECSDDGSGIPYFVRVIHPKKGEVATAYASQDGDYAVDYQHRGKPLLYTVELASDEAFSDVVASTAVELDKIGWWEVTFLANRCGSFKEYWKASVLYGDGRHKKRKK